MLMVQFRLVMVPMTGLEPVRLLHRGILSPLRLPIPPHRLMKKTFARLLEAPPRFELGMKVLQTSALPLGYGATNSFYNISKIS